MRNAFLLLAIATAALSHSVSASGDPVWIPLETGDGASRIAARVIPEEADGVVLDIEVPGFFISETATDRGSLAIIDIPASGRTTAIGKASLPIIRRAIEIPQGGTPKLEILEILTADFDLPKMGLSRRVFPAQPPVEKLPGAREAAEFVISEEFYSLDKAFPDYRARVAETGQMRGHRFAMIEIAPVTYRPLEGRIEVLRSIRVKITTPQADYGLTGAIINRYASPDFERLAQSVLLNYRPPSAKGVPGWPVGYLIITDPDFYDEVQPLAEWKNSKGYQATVTSTSDIPGGATTTAISDYIKDAWQTWPIPPSFVLLVGDVGDIPNFVGVGTNNPATDLYYSTMTDPDYIPDLGIGRFSVTSSTEASTLVEKTVDYEKALFSGTSWLKKAVFMASEDNYTITEGTHNYVISNYLDAAGYTSDKLYCHTYNATTQQVRDAFNEGRGLGIYSGHGAVTYWDDGPYFTQSDVDGLTNVDMYPFVQSYACYTGSYTNPECFAETWIRKVDKAGIAFWGSSVTSYWEEDDVLEKGVFQALFEDSLTWTSGMLDQGKWYLHEYYGGGGSTRRYYEMYNLMGDPSLDIWTDTPTTMTVTHAGTCPVGAGSYTVHADDGKAALADALACLNMPGEVYESGYTDAGGDATLILDPAPSQAGQMFLTVTCHNFVPVIDTVDVMVPAIAVIDPDTIDVQTPTAVSIAVQDTLYQPLQDVIVTIDGWGIEPPLVDTTDALGQAEIVVDAPYGEILTVAGREIGESFDCFVESLVVIGASVLPDPEVEARVDDIGLVGALTPYYEGTIVGRSSHTGLDMFAVGCGVDDFVSSPADTAVLEVTPTGTGVITVALSYPGYEIYTDEIPVITAYGMLAGTVRDASTGDSLPGVPVAVYTSGADTATTPPVFEATSAGDGTYAAPESIAVGPYDVYAAKFGYLAFSGSTMVYWGGNIYDVNMTPAPSGIVSGTVTEQGTGTPVTATIEIYRSDDLSLYSQTSSDSLSGGAYVTDSLPYFTYLFRVKAMRFVTQNVYVTVDEPSETVDFELVPTEGNLLVIDDDTASRDIAAKWGKNGEVIAFDGTRELNTVKSASLIAQDLTDLGYDVTTETSASTDPGTWPDYDIVIWSSGDNTSPVSAEAYRFNLNTYVAALGKLLIEGGEIGYDATIMPGYLNFADTTLHVTGWSGDSSGELTLAAPLHPIATEPNTLPSTLTMTYLNYGDQDALVPDAETEVIYDWSLYSGRGGVLVFDDNADPASSQIIFFSFDYTNVTDTTGRRDLLENAVTHLLADESGPDGSISGTVELSGETSHEGVIVRTQPMGLADTTDASGDYVITGLYDGTYFVTASKPGFADSTVSVEIVGGATVDNVNFTLYPVLEYMDSPEVAIPDNDPTGIRVYIDVDADAYIATVDCYVNLTHTYKGDLIIELTSPEGTTVRLHNQTGGTAEDIITWYDAETQPDGPGSMGDFAGEWAEGEWELWVSDQASGDVGTLHTWGLRMSFPPETAGSDRIEPDIPRSHFLAPSRPNPFSSPTRLRFGLPVSEEVELAIYNIQGQRLVGLASGRYAAGIHDITWDGTDARGKRVASGIYFCRLKAGDFMASRRLVLMR